MGFFDQHAVTLERPTGPESRGADGRIAAVVYSSSSIRGNLQDAPARRIQAQTEGERTEEAWTFATKTELRTRNERTGTPPDRLVVPAPLIDPVNPVTCEVRSVSGPGSAALPHYEARIVRVSEGKLP